MAAGAAAAAAAVSEPSESLGGYLAAADSRGGLALKRGGCMPAAAAIRISKLYDTLDNSEAYFGHGAPT